MSTPRRRIIRSAPTRTEQQNRSRRLQKLRPRLERERALLARWLVRLKRAFHVVEKSLAQVARLEREISRLEGQS